MSEEAEKLRSKEIMDPSSTEPILFDCFNEIEPFACNICPNFRTNFLTSLRHHVIIDCHRERNLEKIYKCLHCSFVTFSRFHYLRHNLSEVCATTEGKGEKPCVYDVAALHRQPEDIRWFPCAECPAKFKTRFCLKIHIQRAHTKREDIYCLKGDRCVSKFKPADVANWFPCDQCPSMFKLREILERHIKNRHPKPEYSVWFKCEKCPLSFKLRSILKEHTKNHHTKPEGKACLNKQTKSVPSDNNDWFECHHCFFKFTYEENLQSHITAFHS